MNSEGLKEKRYDVIEVLTALDRGTEKIHENLAGVLAEIRSEQTLNTV
jgi:hypothetical protein